MALSSGSSAIIVCVLTCSILLLPVMSESSCYTTIFSFGDSLADTGNYLLSGAASFPAVTFLPYGETSFHHPTGRFCNGRLIIDFMAEAYGHPLLPPYLATQGRGSERYAKGVNFAVAGATALNVSYFVERGILGLWTADSLSVQLGWFRKTLQSLCSESCHDYLKRALFVVGEIGGNDFNFAFIQGRKSIDEAVSYVPDVVGAIVEAVNVLIKQGAVELVVPGNLPIGCSTLYLTVFRSANTSDYDPQTGCLIKFNEFAVYYNSYLQDALQKLRKQQPHAKIIYADYYNSAMGFFKNPSKFGFESALKACCGEGEPYNFNLAHMCSAATSVCKDPSKYANWDGIHLTEKAYEWMAHGFVNGLFTHPSLKPPALGH
ncbi:GDSL esterase/lipase At1g28600-like [Nymphaea colorata]|nr:GDSL esterase/lipase At1g28600-like [Nymphaea colorata]